MRPEPSILALTFFLLSQVSALPITPRKGSGFKYINDLTTSDHHIISPLTPLLKTSQDRERARAQERERIESGATQITRVSAYLVDREGNRITKRGEDLGFRSSVDEEGLEGREGQVVKEHEPPTPRADGQPVQ